MQGAFLMVPAAPGPAPVKGMSGAALESFRNQALALTSIAGLCGLPQVTLPCARVDNAPVGLGLIGPRNSDEQLLEVAAKISQMLQTAVDT
jgi:amidase